MSLLLTLHVSLTLHGSLAAISHPLRIQSLAVLSELSLLGRTDALADGDTIDLTDTVVRRLVVARFSLSSIVVLPDRTDASESNCERRSPSGSLSSFWLPNQRIRLCRACCTLERCACAARRSRETST